ncbi:MAG: hypothetical protein H0U12_11420 [Thermoleophilaceae bacterium]|nr:hypothetical protein [Thermoleophilaceae bacterium]
MTLGLLLELTAALVVLSAAELAPRVRRADWGGFWAWWRLQTRPLGKGMALASASAAWPPVRQLLRPDYVFVVYPGTEAHKRHYFPPWIERTLRPVFPIGVIRFGPYRGVTVSGLASDETLEGAPERLEAFLSEIHGQFRGAEVIALGGRLPSLAVKSGIGLAPPFTHGDRGTVCAMLWATRQLAQRLGKPTEKVTLAVVGAAGFIGSRLIESLTEEFGQVIAVDPRYAGASSEAGNVVCTARAEDVADAEAVMVLSARGSDTAPVARHLAPGTVVADDTHPEIPEKIREAMAGRGATVFKATVADDRVRFVPPIPDFRSGDIPGCLLEALVVVQRGQEILDCQSEFNRAADSLGFGAGLTPHLRRRERTPGAIDQSGAGVLPYPALAKR